jgi:ornithine carbamoyltransferase
MRFIHPTKPMAHFLNIIDHNRDTLLFLLDLASRRKAESQQGEFATPLRNKIVSLVFEKPSLRTRVSFEAGITQLGGTSLFQSGNEVGLGSREPICDFARTMSEYVNGLVLRVFKQSTVHEVAKYASIPVINGLSDLSHPCQALADLLTIQEVCGTFKGKRVVFVGDGNNVARSLAAGCAKIGIPFILTCPEGYGFDEDFFNRLQNGGETLLPEEVRDPNQAIQKADIIYTDVWTSMGQESEREDRLKKFASYQLNSALMSKAPKHIKVLHCLPAHRGEEITQEVVEQHSSTIFQQAGNRMHAQKAILEWLIGS